MEYRYEIRDMSGRVCCKGQKLEDLCAGCREIETTPRGKSGYKFEFRNLATGEPCCVSDAPDAHCPKCALPVTPRHQSRAATASRAPEPPSLIALIKDGPKPHAFQPPEPRVVSREKAKSPERMPPPPSMAELYRKEANR